MGNTSKTGLIGQTAVLNRLVQLGYEVLLPWSQDLGYDLAYYVETEERQFGFFAHLGCTVLTQERSIWFPYGTHQMHLI